MATFKGQLETKTGTNTSDVLYPETSVDQIVGLPIPTAADSGKVVGVDSNGNYVLVEAGGGGGSYMLYRHNVVLLAPVTPSGYLSECTLKIITTSPEPFTDITDIKRIVDDNDYIIFYSSNMSGNIGICSLRIVSDENYNLGLVASFILSGQVNTEIMAMYIQQSDTWATIDDDFVSPY